MLHFVDGNYLLHRSIHKGQNLYYNGTFTGGAFLFLKSLLSFASLDNTVIVFDGGHSKRRRQLLESYKVKKKKEDYEQFRELFSTSKKIIEEIIQYTLCIVIQAPGVEADDVIYLLSVNKQNSVVHTDDEDYLQLLNYNVSIHRPMKGEYYSSIIDFKERYGFHPKYLTLKKALTGDRSDNIPGIKGIGDKKATKIVKLLEEHQLEPKPENLVKIATYLKSSDRRLVVTNIELVKRNLELIDFRYVDVKKEEINPYIKKGNKDEIALVKTLQKYGFKSLLSRFIGA